MQAFETLIAKFETSQFNTESELIAASSQIESQSQRLHNISPALFKVLQARFKQAQQIKFKQFQITSNLDIIDVLKDIQQNLRQENARAELALTEIASQTSNLQAIGVSADRISAFADQGKQVTKGVRFIEQRDRMLTTGLFCVFVASSFWIVFRRVFRWIK
ncbi:Sec20 [Spironucleus salmonicida]|uniref:Sec20 n=1 Tax=Spironucleus salmonicida TaxID=348837 RepID=V6M7H1_9EUKA|nr:Sec20 [Spironucleus salmonicida]|eukprot:EST49394.1 Sec20 [Spironucleus salmonicida]